MTLHHCNLWENADAFERFLCAKGFSPAQARSIAAQGFAGMRGTADVDALMSHAPNRVFQLPEGMNEISVKGRALGMFNDPQKVAVALYVE